jgi:AcrR family transcriptional regulator
VAATESRPLRADAQRNRDRLLAVAARAFAQDGPDVTLDSIAKEAGVGIGTLYRHFPTREALLEALLSSRFDRLRDRADSLLTSEPPLEAFRRWLSELAVGSTTYRGLPEEVMTALRDKDSQLHASCVAMRAAGARLLKQAQDSGAVRPDVTADEALSLAAGVAWVAEQSPDPAGRLDKLLSIVMSGLEV